MSTQADSSSQRSNQPWTKDEMERLVAWMEENPQDLKGKQIAWHKDVKDQVFSEPGDEHITVKKITEKASNMKRRWKEAKAMAELSGWGVRLEDNEQTINDVLERKCAFYWRLDGIWGTRPNASIIIGSMESTNPPDVSQAASTSRTSDTHDGTQLDWSPSPSRQPSPTRQPSPARQPSPPAQSTPAPTIKFRSTPAATPSRSTPTPTPSSSRSSTPSQLRMKKRDSGSMLRQTLEERYDVQEELASKRHKIEIDVKREKMAAEERIANARIAAEERIADRQLEQGKEIAKMQNEAQSKQIESFTRVMEKMMDVFSASAGAARGKDTENL